MLLITPRLARTLARPDAASVEFAAGTEASTGTPRLGAAPPIIPGIAPQPPISGGAAPTESTGTQGEAPPIEPAV